MLTIRKKEYPKQKPHILEEAKAAEAVKDYDTAETLYRKIIKAEQEHIDGLLGLVRVHYARSYWAEADILLDYILKFAPDQSEGLEIKERLLEHFKKCETKPTTNKNIPIDQNIDAKAPISPEVKIQQNLPAPDKKAMPPQKEEPTQPSLLPSPPPPVTSKSPSYELIDFDQEITPPASIKDRSAYDVTQNNSIPYLPMPIFETTSTPLHPTNNKIKLKDDF